MNARTPLLAVCICLALGVSLAHAESSTKSSTVTTKTKTVAPAMDPKAMEEAMMKAATPGPQHERLKKLVGEWNCTVSMMMDPSQPAQETKSTAVVTSLMDGRYFQEQDTGEMMGKPFLGQGLTGYDNVMKKYVSTWIDNAGTGIMTSEGTPDATGNVITWTGWSSDPMTGKKTKYRMVTTFIDDNKHTFEMFGAGPGGKESKMMTITYDRKM
jgi:hypothetical protein